MAMYPLAGPIEFSPVGEIVVLLLAALIYVGIGLLGSLTARWIYRSRVPPPLRSKGAARAAFVAGFFAPYILIYLVVLAERVGTE